MRCERCGESIPVGSKAYVLNDDTVLCFGCFDSDSHPEELDVYSIIDVKGKDED